MKDKPTSKDDSLKDFRQGSFNRREPILEAVNFAAERLLKTTQWQTSIPGILERLGKATEVSRVYIYQDDCCQDSTLTVRRLYEWTQPCVAIRNDRPRGRISPSQVVRLPGWMNVMKRGQAVHGLTKDLPADEKDILSLQGIKSVIAVPIIIDEKWWGFIGFDECLSERLWSEAEVAALKTAANIIGAAICRELSDNRLRESERRYKELADFLPQPVFEIDLDGKLIFANRSASEYFGYTEEDFRKGLNALDMFATEDRKRLSEAIQKRLTDDSWESIELSARRKDGSIFPVLVTAAPIDRAGEPIGLRGILFDTSERKRAEQALRQSEARYRAIVEDQTELISRFAPDGTLTFVNDAYCRYFGETEDQLIGHRFWHHVPTEDQEKFKQHLAKLNPQNLVATIEHRVYTSTGEMRWQQWTDRAIRDDRGNIVEFQAVGRDITERRKAEEALRESEKQMRYLSSQILKAQEQERQRIARDLHDSIIQSLATIKINLRVNLKHLAQDQPEKTCDSFESIVSMIQDTIEEVRRVYTDLRPSMLDNLGILTTISWACREFEQTHRQIRVLTKTDVKEDEISETLKIVIYRIMQEALNNIAKHSKANLIDISLSKDDGKIHLTIEDNGCGFDVAAMLSDQNNRHGLGLVSMKERTELSGGTFTIESAEQRGTTIRSSWRCNHSDNG